jgi:hypothetical protein
MNKKDFIFLVPIALIIIVIMINMTVKQKNVILEKKLSSPCVVLPSIPYIIVTIDGCQYIESFDTSYCYTKYSLCHKGDCTNLIHKISLRKLAEETKN